MKLRRPAFLLALSSFGWWLSAGVVHAQVNTDYQNLILGNTSPIDLAILIINWSLGILALIALGIVLYGGFVWIFSQGEEEKISRAKGILRNGLIGLFIILAAWGIATYIINLLLDVTNAEDQYYSPSEPYEPSDGSPFYIDHSNPHDGEDNVPLCHIIAVTFSYPLNEPTVTNDTFKVTVPYDAITNPNGGKNDSESCAENKQCLSGLCQDNGDICSGNQVAGSFDFSESSYAAVFYPETDYESDTTYAVSLSTDIEGVDPDTGAVYRLTSGDSKRNFIFSTGTATDNIPPKVDVVQITPYPNDEAEGICLNPTLQVSFSESLDPASPDDQNFWLYPMTDKDGDGVDDAPSDTLDIDYTRMSSIGGEEDDTIVTKPQDQLSAFSRYGINLYSGDAATENFDGAIYDTCGNPLSGNFDDTMSGSPVDDFVDPASSGINQAFCTCTSGIESCQVTGGNSTCGLPSGGTCDIQATCDGDYKDFVGFDYQWTWTTGDQAYCVPEIDTVTQQDTYYSEDKDPLGETESADTGKVLVTGNYLYPFYDVDFYKNISAAGMNCFDTGFSPVMSCFVGNTNDTAITLRTPVASQTGHLTVENSDGVDTSADVAIIDSPYVRNTSPLTGPAGQYVTIRGNNFGDYDPEVSGSQRGHVYFDGIEAEVMCNDGWDDDAIIVRVPEAFAPEAVPKIQVVTTGPDGTVNNEDDKHSNQEGFTVSDGEPGPGLCELEPNCSDTGADDVTVIGENFGNDGTVYFDPPADDYIEGVVKQWNVYNDLYKSATVVTDKTPVTEPNTYTFTAANVDGISNGLDFNITCSEPPRVFEYYQCDLNDTFYLPNPRGYASNACVNSVLYFGFNQNMSDSTVTAGVKVYQCNEGDSLDDATCTTEIAGSMVAEYLNDAYIGGDGTVMMDGTTDIDGDGDTDVNDAYSAYTFYPTSKLLPNYHYKVVIPNTVTNDNAVPMAEPYTWNFQVRDDGTNCVADYLSLAPYSQIENNYDATNACLDNYTYNDTSYTYRARPLSSDCLVLDDAGDYRWTIKNDETKSVLGFGDNAASETITDQILDTTTRGYNTVCLQGDESINEGNAVVTANLLDPSALSEVAASDDAVVTVDFGYCTQDSDCYTDQCRDTYCDPQTSHCAPDIIGFSPDNASTPDVGPTGCLTMNGCYFGTNQALPDSCKCNSQKQAGETCAVDVNATTCLLDDRTTTCSLGETICTLTQECNEESPEADYSQGFFGGCTCEVTPTQTCTVAGGATTCVAAGNDLCTSSYGTYETGVSGNVTLNSTAITYPNAEICSDTWDNDQVIIKIPNDGSVPAGDYSLTLDSYYALTDTYGVDAGDASNCTVGSDPTPCLCLVDPDHGEEGNLVNLYGEGFKILTQDDGEKVTFTGAPTRVASKNASWLASGQAVTDVDIAEGAVSDLAGVQLESTHYQSNALEFTVSCASNLDCGTGCCSEGQCSAAEACNTCETDGDCAYGSCQSACVDGICKPYITDISPTKGAVGQPVTVQGCYFGSYYDPDLYDPGSLVTVDDIPADLACNTTDSWNNQQIIMTIPDGIFASEEDELGIVQVQQSYSNFEGQLSQVSNTVEFKKDNSCSAINLPILCDAEPAYSPYQTLTDGTENIALTGEHFTDESGGYCTCELATMGVGIIPEGDSLYTKTKTYTYYVNPDNISEQCSDGTTGAATLNAYTVYQPTSGQCVYTSPQDSDITCTIAVGDTSCAVPVTETCYVDEAKHDQVCNDTVDSFVELDGSVEYYDDAAANIDWGNYTTIQYITDVPEDSATGDVTAIATTEGNTQCVSNGLEFPVTCNSCGDCASGAGLNCDLEYDPAFGACTADTTGFCRTSPSSCCNYTSCVYNEDDAADAGTCAPQPLLLFDDSDGDDVSDPLEEKLGYDSLDTDSDDDNVLDGDEAGTTTGNITGDVVTSDTTPNPNATDVCPNAQFTLQFNQTITTSDAYPFNNNELTAEEAAEGIDLTTDDIPLGDIDFDKYVYLRPEYYDDSDNATVLSDVVINVDQQTLTLALDEILDFSTSYEIIVKADEAIASGTENQTGIVSLADGVAVGCSTDQAALGLCGDTYIKLTFTTLNQSKYQTACGPSYTVLEADSTDFIEQNYTFSQSEQEEPFSGTVYAAGLDGQPDQGTADVNGDGIDDGADDQSIQRIDDGADAGYDWTYAWDPVYATLADLENSSCPVAGILTADQEGSCECTVEESCTIAPGAASCTVAGVSCVTDSPSEVCDSLDSQYSAAGCKCDISGSCTISAGDAACDVAIDEQTISCTTDSSSGVCDAKDSGWTRGAFTEDQSSQIVTADTPDPKSETTDTINLTVTGDGSVEQGWGNPTDTVDDLTDSVLVDIEYCSDPDYLVTYSNSSYNFYWSYCRGSSPQLSSFLPKFEVAFERSDAVAPTIDTVYGSDMDFIYEVAFKDANALTNDASSNNNTIAIRVYPNDLDSNTSTIEDSVNPVLWYLLNTNDAESGYTETTLDDYQAVTVGNTTYVAISDLNDSSGRTLPYVFVLAYSGDATKETSDVVQAIIEGLRFNRNDVLSDECAITKAEVIRDTKRVNDLGTVAYLLSSYYYNDSDANDQEDFPTLENASYITGLSTSVWPSWDDTLGSALGQNLPVDPTNEFAEAENNCPYNPPDIGAGETNGTYYDEAGTCWDPVLKDFYGPEASQVYLYQYHDANQFGLYANLEFIDMGTDYNPCRSYEDGSTVDTSISDYSNQGCDTFNYKVDQSQTTTNTAYDDLF